VSRRMRCISAWQAAVRLRVPDGWLAAGRSDRLRALAGRLDPRRDRVIGLLAIGTVGSLAAVSVIAGVSASTALPRISNIGAWLTNTGKNFIVHANGLSGKVDARVPVTGQDDPLKIVQDGKIVVVVDEATGQVSRIDPAQLQVTETRSFGSGGVQVVAGSGLAYVITPARGTVQQINPATLATIGAPVRLRPPLGQAAIDNSGVLWVLLPPAGQAVPIEHGQARTPAAVGRAGDQLALTIANGSPLVTDGTAATATLVGRNGARLRVNLPRTIASAPLRRGTPRILAPATANGPVSPILAPGARSLVLVNTATGAVSNVPLAAAGQLGTPQVLGERVYIPDQRTGGLIVYDSANRQFDSQIPVTGHPGSLEAFVQDGILWVNDSRSQVAMAIDSTGAIHRIGKYTASHVPGAPHPTEPGPAPSSTSGPLPGPAPSRQPRTRPSTRPSKAPTPNATSTSTPTPGVPGPPGTPATTSGAGYIDVSFTPSSGSTPTGYKLEIAGSPPGMSVQPSQMPPGGSFIFHVTGGSCSQQYRFRVSALYQGGQVTSGWSAPARPCVAPSAPSGFTATGVNHGANLSWSAPANGQPLAYTLSWSGATSGSTSASGTSAQVTGLTNGGQYSFILTAANAAGSAQATATASLVPPPQSFSAFNNQSGPVTVRSGPSTSAGSVGQIPQGSSMGLTVHCQVLGGSATDPFQTWKTSQLWDEIDWNGGTAYVSDLYVNTPHSAGTGSSAPDPYAPNDYSYPPLWQCS
jgi:uncharacterized protein YraI